ncbi:LOW QUALITY PROTEIN: F-box protein At1g54550-like [Raphanus sativus]|uniref:LOW QUALITY PROTEIN: F-box protein At1g54550-like n=1 Tax=Raphanus sativus TaxID=3726 RepID=A0A9W3CXI3_RAPSA|nr:LOW QUALITY PROTEIN: F-box protein At1g54550-like [Raphanus sativus]
MVATLQRLRRVSDLRSDPDPNADDDYREIQGVQDSSFCSCLASVFEKTKNKSWKDDGISDLPRDLIGEIFSRVPLTSLRAVRSTCKTWKICPKFRFLGQKAAKRNQFLEFVVVNQSVCSLTFDLQGIRNDDYVLAHPSIKKINIPNHHVEIYEVFHCDGLLLCELYYDPTKILVWNVFGQTRLIQARTDNQSRIWITTKIEPNEISWSSFLRLDMRLIKDLPYNFMPCVRSFFIDEENKVAVFINKFAIRQFHSLTSLEKMDT